MKRFPGVFRVEMTFLCAACGAATFAAPLSPGAEGVDFGLELRPAVVQVLPGYLATVTVPAALRTVPINPADAGAGEPILIPGASVMPGTYDGFASAIAPELGYGRVRFRAGLVLSENAFSPVPETCSCGTTQEANYQGSGRTVGAALVYWAIVGRPSVPGVMGEFEVRAGRGISLLAGLQRTGQTVSISTGWDRYDSLQQYQSHLISSNWTNQPYAGVRLTQGEGRAVRISEFVFVGPALLETSPSALGKTAALRYGAHPIGVSVGFGLTWDWRHTKSAR